MQTQTPNITPDSQPQPADAPDAQPAPDASADDRACPEHRSGSLDAWRDGISDACDYALDVVDVIEPLIDEAAAELNRLRPDLAERLRAYLDEGRALGREAGPVVAAALTHAATSSPAVRATFRDIIKAHVFG